MWLSSIGRCKVQDRSGERCARQGEEEGRMSRPKFCAVCAGDRRPIHMARLEDDGPLFALCDRCDSEDRIEAWDSERGYETPLERDGGGSVANIAAMVRDERWLEKEAWTRGTKHQRIGCATTSRTPGYLLMRVPARVGGKSRDARTALIAEFGNKPWADEVRYLGFQGNEHLFERPDPKLVAQIRADQQPDPLLAIDE